MPSNTLDNYGMVNNESSIVFYGVITEKYLQSITHLGKSINVLPKERCFTGGLLARTTEVSS